jgi:DNA-binding IclR family transcriptional regulator
MRWAMPRTKKKNDQIYYRVPAVEKSFAILEMFASKNKGYTISEVSRLLHLPISTTSSLLYTMLHSGYLKRHETGSFTLTTKLLSESSKLLNQIDLRDVVQPELVRLAKSTGLASVLSVREGDELVCIDKVEGNGQIRIASYIGKRFPMHSTCTGKAVLAFQRDEEVDEIIKRVGLEKSTENSITSLSTLKKELARVRAQGFATDNEEYNIGIGGVAAPTFDHSGNVVGAIAVGGAVFELDTKQKDIIASVKESARLISEHLGFQETIVTKSYRRA